MNRAALVWMSAARGILLGGLVTNVLIGGNLDAAYFVGGVAVLLLIVAEFVARRGTV